MRRCVIVTAGPMGDYDKLKNKIEPDDYIICADGGIDHLKGLGLKPDLIIGDLDSAQKLPDGIEVKRFKSEKDETDTMLAVMHALDRGFKEIVLLGGLKGRLDHTFANLSCLQYIHRRGARGCFLDSDNEAYFVENGSIKFNPRKGYYISVFPFGGNAAGVTEKGFKYSLDNAVMTTELPIGVSNEFLDGTGEISVKSGALLIILSKK